MSFEKPDKDLNTRLNAQYIVHGPNAPRFDVPPPYVPDELLGGNFAHSVRTYVEGPNIIIDFSYQAPLEWYFASDGSQSRISVQHVVVSRVLMPWGDFLAWMDNSARALGYIKKEEASGDRPAE